MRAACLRLGVFVLAAWVALAAGMSAADVLTQLGITAAQAQEAVKQAVSSGWFNYRAARTAFLAAPSSVRGEMAEGMIAWARTFASTPEFKAAYQQARANRKPTAPSFEGTPEQEFQREREKQQADMAKSAEEMKATLAQMSPEQRKQIEDAMKSSTQMMAQLDTPEMRKMQIDGIRMTRASQQQEYEAALAKWQQDFPEDVTVVVARRLTSFLEQTADVAFDAKLTPCGDKKCFADAQYENKPEIWKVAYRAGKEPVTRARAAAQTWLSSLPK
jgi:hypothetical protein